MILLDKYPQEMLFARAFHIMGPCFIIGLCAYVLGAHTGFGPSSIWPERLLLSATDITWISRGVVSVKLIALNRQA